MLFLAQHGIVELLSLIRRFPYTRPRHLPVLLLSVAVFWIAARRPDLGSAWFRRAGRAFARLAHRRRLSVLLVALTSFLIGAALSLWVRMPLPNVHDEFSYLLAADTFAHGRLANPTHPLWPHFEAFHILQQPAYASKYPPAQGLLLALGQALFGHPIVGVWLSVAQACAALCWMLQAWMPPRWALAGGLIAAVHPLCIQWSQVYWGGGLAMAGGALLLGGFRRSVREPRARDAFAMALGIAILANNRPYEGLILSLLVGASLLLWRTRRDGAGLRRIALPGLATLVPIAVLMGCYNRSVTGSPFRMPYVEYAAQYDPVPLFLLQRPRSPRSYRHEAFDRYYNVDTIAYYRSQIASPGALLAASKEKAGVATEILSRFPILALSLCVLLMALLRRRRKRSAPSAQAPSAQAPSPQERWAWWGLTTLALFVAALLVETYRYPHYAAPAVGLMFLLSLLGLRFLSQWRWGGRPLGRWVTRTLPILCGASLLHSVAFWESPPFHPGVEQRARIERALCASGERHLIIVRYASDHWPHFDWIHNRADIDSAPVVWARDLDPAQNQRLLRYFHHRRAWLLEADAADPVLVPYPAH